MNDLENLFELIKQIRMDSDYTILQNIPDEFLKSNAEINKMTSQLYKRLNSKKRYYCLFPYCNDESIKSHSLQKALLKSIADESNHVFKLKIHPNFRPNGKIETLIEKIGINEASTFEGFCSKHDTEIFLPIEQGCINANSDKHNFLLLYRSVSREYFEVNKSHNMMKGIIMDMIKDMEEKNPLGPFLLSQLYMQFLELFHIEKIKNFLDLCYENKIYKTIFEYQYIKLEKNLKLFVNSFFAIQGSDDSFIIRKDITNEMPAFFSMTIIPTASETYIYFAYLIEQKEELTPFIDRFFSSNIQELEIFLTDTIFRNSDNIFIQPKFWESISEIDRNDYLDFFLKTTNNREYSNEKKLNIFK